MANSASTLSVDVMRSALVGAVDRRMRRLTSLSQVNSTLSIHQHRQFQRKSNDRRNRQVDLDDDDDDDDDNDDNFGDIELCRILNQIALIDASQLDSSLLAPMVALLQIPSLAALTASVCATVLLKLRPGTPLDSAVLNALLPPLLSLAVSSPRDSAVQLDAFRALAALVLERGALLLPSLHDALVVSLLALIDDSKRPSPELLRMSFNTLGNLCIGTHAALAAQHYAALTAALALHLDAGVRAFFAGKRTAARSLCAVLRAWTLVLPECAKAYERYFADLCLRLRELVFLRPTSSVLQSTSTTTSSSVVSNSTLSNESGASGDDLPVSSGAHNNRASPLGPLPPLLRLPPQPAPPSVSSGSESTSSPEADLRKRAVKVQLAALTCLQQAARVNAVSFFAIVLARSMPQLSLDTSPILAAMTCTHGSTHQSLLALAACADAPAAVRLGCVSAISVCLDGARQLLHTLAPAPNRRPRQAAFTSLSNATLQTVSQLHDELSRSIDCAPVGRTLSAVLHCSNVLVLNTPYAALGDASIGLRVPMARSCAKRLRSLLIAPADNAAAVVMAPSSDAEPHAELALSLALFAACVHVAPPNADIAEVVFGDGGDAGGSLYSVMLAFGETLVADSQTIEPTVVAELLSALTSCATQYIDGVLTFWVRVQSLCRHFIASSSTEASDTAALAGLRALETGAHALAFHARQTADGAASLAALSAAHARFIVQSIIADDRLATRSAQVRAALCSCLTAIGPHGFGSLQHHEQVHCLTALLGASSDASAVVRAGALRALGVFVLFPDLRADTAFVLDVAHALIVAMNDDQLSVRVRAAWSIANVCDTLVTTADTPVDQAFGHTAIAPPIDAMTFADDDGGGDMSEQALAFGADSGGDEQQSLLADLPLQTLVDLAKTALKASTDHERVRPNAMRALGHFARFAPLSVLLLNNEQLVSAGLRGPLIAAIIEALAARLGAGSAKVRWNASYALGSLLRNAALRRQMLTEPALADAPWFAPRLFGALETACRTSPNFKVRINSALAIAAAPHRVLFGTTTFGLTMDTIASLLFRSNATNGNEADDNNTTTDPAAPGTAMYARRWNEQLDRTLLHLIALSDVERDASLAIWRELRAEIVALIDRNLNELEMARRRREHKGRKAGDAMTSDDRLDNARRELLERASRAFVAVAGQFLSEEEKIKLIIK